MAVTSRASNESMRSWSTIDDLPTLPNEIVIRIATFVAKIGREEHSWLHLRRVSRLWRDAIEEAFVDYYLRRMSVDVDGGWDRLNEDGRLDYENGTKTILGGLFEFERLERQEGLHGSDTSRPGNIAVLSMKDTVPSVLRPPTCTLQNAVDFME